MKVNIEIELMPFKTPEQEAKDEKFKKEQIPGF